VQPPLFAEGRRFFIVAYTYALVDDAAVDDRGHLWLATAPGRVPDRRLLRELVVEHLAPTLVERFPVPPIGGGPLPLVRIDLGQLHELFPASPEAWMRRMRRHGNGQYVEELVREAPAAEQVREAAELADEVMRIRASQVDAVAALIKGSLSPMEAIGRALDAAYDIGQLQERLKGLVRKT